MAKYNKQTSSTKHTHKLYLNRSDIKHKRHEKVGVIAVRGMHTHTHAQTHTIFRQTESIITVDLRQIWEYVFKPVV